MLGYRSLNIEWSPAVVTLVALGVAITASTLSSINLGVLSIALALLIGQFSAGMSAAEVTAGFPVPLFLTLLGVTLLFSAATQNGTLTKLARRALDLVPARRGWIPIAFFLLALLTAGVIGSLAAAAMLAPVALRMGRDAGISPFLMILMVANGGNAGVMSPFAPAGVIANGTMDSAGLPGHEWSNYWNTLLAQSFVGLCGFTVAGGFRLFGEQRERRRRPTHDQEAFTRPQFATLAILAAFAATVVLLGAPVGTAGLLASTAIFGLGLADSTESIRGVPWGVLLMACGVTVLVGVSDHAGGLELASGLLAQATDSAWTPGLLGFVVGLVSVYSSSSGVVIPAFMPMVPRIVEAAGAGDPLMLAYTINVGSHVVDVSPLSALGAVCLASVPEREDRQSLFRRLMFWGLSMTVVGGALCQVFFGFLR